MMWLKSTEHFFIHMCVFWRGTVISTLDCICTRSVEILESNRLMSGEKTGQAETSLCSQTVHSCYVITSMKKKRKEKPHKGKDIVHLTAALSHLHAYTFSCFLTTDGWVVWVSHLIPPKHLPPLSASPSSPVFCFFCFLTKLMFIMHSSAVKHQLLNIGLLKNFYLLHFALRTITHFWHSVSMKQKNLQRKHRSIHRSA